MQCMKIHIAADDIIMIILSLFLETQNTMLSHQIIMHPDPSQCEILLGILDHFLQILVNF